MYHLEQVDIKKVYTISWLLGSLGKDLMTYFHFETGNTIQIRVKDEDCFIVEYNRKRYILDQQYAHAIVVC